MRNNLEASHWHHSRGWAKTYVSQNKETYIPKNSKSFSVDRKFGVHNTLNQIATHFKVGNMQNNYTTMAQTQFRDNSNERQPIFETNKMKNYQETNHFRFGNIPEPLLTTTWSHFSKRHVLAAQQRANNASQSPISDIRRGRIPTRLEGNGTSLFNK